MTKPEEIKKEIISIYKTRCPELNAVVGCKLFKKACADMTCSYANQAVDEILTYLHSIKEVE